MRGAAPRHGHCRGGSRTKIHGIWATMLARCKNPNVPAYKDYGGRGIKVCERWHKFENFLADMGEPPEGRTIDRYPNNDGNYEPGNCRWATAEEQGYNKRDTVRVTANGENKTLLEWAQSSGMKLNTIRHRIYKLKWPPERAVTEPPDVSHKAPKKSRVLLTVDGVSAGMAEWSRRTGVSIATIWARIQDGWDHDRAVKTPARSMRRAGA